MGAPDVQVREGYRRAALALARWTGSHRGRALLVTSARLGEGTTTTALQVASHLRAEHGLTPIVVELPRTRPEFADRFGLDGSRTLDAALSGRLEPTAAVQTTSSGLVVMPAGPAPALSGAEDLRRVIEALAAAYDLVVVDAPPILEGADTVIAGTAVPHALLVVQAGRTSAEGLRRAQRDLEAEGVTIIATVLNRHRRFIPEWIYRWLTR